MTSPTSSSSSTTTWATPTSAATAAKSRRRTSTAWRANGLRFSQFYNTARCSPSRASLLTGLHPHQTGIGILTYDSGPDGYAGNLNQRCATIAELLKPAGYRTYMSGKWHVSSNLTQPTDSWPMQRGFDDFFGTIIGAGSFYDPNTLTRGNENAEHEARAPGFFYTDAISDEAVQFIASTRRSTRTSRSSSTSPTPRRTGRCTRTPRTSPSTRAASTPAGTGCASSGWSAGRVRHPRRAVEADRRDPTPAGLDRGRAQGLAGAAWRCMRRRSTAWTRASAASWRALEETGQLDNTLVIFLADNGACAEDIPENVTIDELVNKLMIARSHTRDGGRCTSATTRTRAGAGRHLPELRPGLGQPVEHAVPPVQALDPRRRHLHAADLPLAAGHRGQAARSATRRATCPTSWPPSAT